MQADSARSLRRAVALVLAAAVAVPAAWSQADAGPTLEEIIVTAQKREETLREVPISVNAISGEKIAEVGIVRLDDLKAYVPNLQVTETGIANNIYIRGIGSGLNQGFEQSVSIYADGIYRGRGHQSRMPFLDLARVEVLRGPQPILFGKNAIAGAVNLVSARPTPEFEGSVRAMYEVENSEQVADLVLSGPVAGPLGARLAVRYRESDGYVKNLTLSRDEPARDELAGRLTLELAPDEDFSASLRLEAGSFDVVGRQVEAFGELPAAPYLRPRDNVVVNPPIPGLTYSQILRAVLGRDPSVLNTSIDYQRSSNGDWSYLDTREAALTINWGVGDVTVTSVTGYSKYELDELCDCDFTGADVFTAGITEDFDQFSQEIRVASDTGQQLEWIAGLFYQTYDLIETDYVHVPSNSIIPALSALSPAYAALRFFADTANPRLFTQSSELYAVFAQGSWNVSDSFRITAGGRWSSEDKEGARSNDLTAGLGGPSLPPGLIDVLYDNFFGISRHSVEGSRSESKFTPLVNLQYRFGDDSMAYLSWARGNKSGGYDARSNKSPAQGGTFEYEPEEADSYELGLKWGIGRSAELTAALFYTDYTDLQTSAFDGRLGFNVGNGSAEVRGLELEGRWQATDSLYLFGSFAYLDFEWSKYFGQCYYNPPPALVVPPNCNYEGSTNQLNPEITAVIGADFRRPLGDALELRTSLDVNYTDKFLTSLTLDPNSAQSGYAKVNARIALASQSGRWEMALIGRNLTDETTISYSGDTPLAGSTFGARSYYGFTDPPRTLAIEALLRF
ncbi:MAG: TonB-dependent receptor [Gammaproteobacteria bacterium]|nr:MAG: TonB-dependent receptor [Gammaproteobacteria bacterium]